MWNLKYDTNEPVYEKEKESQNRLELREGWIGRCKLLYTKQINKVLLYSMENYIQKPVINSNGKECKNRMYI